MTRYLRLGASLYVPATHPDLLPIGNREKYPQLRSVIFCTEDAVRADDVPRALANLGAALPRFEPASLLRYVRVRNPAVLRSLLGLTEVGRLDGFVLPKVTAANLDDYFRAFADTDPFEVMVTLETVEVFDTARMAELRDLLCRPEHRRRILSLRVGGNDLFNLLGLRRPRGRSIYSTPLRLTIANLVTTFRPHGFNLAAPVFEYLDRGDVLAREVRHDLAMGLFGKSAIHPQQVPLIESAYRVTPAELEMAERVLAWDAPPVFRLHDAMCEPATHRTWALLTRERAQLYGIADRKATPTPKRASRNGTLPDPAR
ncbi:MAG: HpcH/HpaI aldolase/citrate lyase family protein [Gemmataceae bacterium]|nr:HpcH/HpaI aldolase/citrate lyase family protein [Gemmataceae bacterium]